MKNWVTDFKTCFSPSTKLKSYTFKNLKWIFQLISFFNLQIKPKLLASIYTFQNSFNDFSRQSTYPNKK